ncbi:MAG: hypothetical protein M1330_01845 [Armatimonadetes bacterium]|nr:hypothetical protein [Armatimonadota bacterium]
MNDHGIRSATAGDIAFVQEAVNRLNPFGRSIIPQLLKREEEKCGVGYAVGTNRYCIADHRGKLKHWTEHGFGGLITPNGESLKEFAKTLWEAVLKGEPVPLKKGKEWCRILARRKVAIRTPAVWTQLKRYYPDISPFNFIQRVKPVWVMGDRRMKNEERILYAPFRDTDKESLRLKWVDQEGLPSRACPQRWRRGIVQRGEAKRITPGDLHNIGMASPGIIAVETLAQLYDNFVNHTDPRTITLSGEEVKGITGGMLRPRPLMITELYPIGRESNRLLGPREGGEADDLLEPATLFQLDAKTAVTPKDRAGGIPSEAKPTVSELTHKAIERLKPYPGDLMAKAIGVSPRTWDSYKNSIRTPPILIARKLSALVTSLPAAPPSNRVEQIRLLNEFIRLQSGTAGRPRPYGNGDR